MRRVRRQIRLCRICRYDGSMEGEAIGGGDGCDDRHRGNDDNDYGDHDHDRDRDHGGISGPKHDS